MAVPHIPGAPTGSAAPGLPSGRENPGRNPASLRHPRDYGTSGREEAIAIGIPHRFLGRTRPPHMAEAGEECDFVRFSSGSSSAAGSPAQPRGVSVLTKNFEDYPGK